MKTRAKEGRESPLGEAGLGWRNQRQRTFRKGRGARAGRKKGGASHGKCDALWGTIAERRGKENTREESEPEIEKKQKQAESQVSFRSGGWVSHELTRG